MFVQPASVKKQLLPVKASHHSACLHGAQHDSLCTVTERTQNKQSAAKPQRPSVTLQTSQHQDNPSEAASMSQASCKLPEPGAAYQEGASITVLQHEPGFLGGLRAGVAAGVFIGLLVPQGVKGVRAPNVCVLQH